MPRFANAHHRAPRIAEPGGEGEERELRLELKLLADVGLVGLPNAGKSTLISAVSAARPKIADYPFTTLVPQLGVVAEDRLSEPFVIADLPGLIAGASDGTGLGHQFLRHVERCRVLVHLVDLSGLGQDPDDPGDAEGELQTLEKELAAFKPELLERSRLVVGSKIDAALEERRNALKRAAQRREIAIFRDQLSGPSRARSAPPRTPSALGEHSQNPCGDDGGGVKVGLFGGSFDPIPQRACGARAARSPTAQSRPRPLLAHSQAAP